MKRIVYIILLLSLPLLGYGQFKLSISKMQGIWKCSDSFTIKYRIIKNNTFLDISYIIENKHCYTLGDPYSYIGFWNEELHGGAEPKHISDLDSSGERLYTYLELGISYDRNGNLIGAPVTNFITCNSYNEDNDETFGDTLSIYALTLFDYNDNPYTFSKVEIIPDKILIALKNYKEKDGLSWRNYLSYMHITEASIKREKVALYSSPQKATSTYLHKGDEIEILEEKDGWLRVQHFGKKSISNGWIKKEDN